MLPLKRKLIQRKPEFKIHQKRMTLELIEVLGNFINVTNEKASTYSNGGHSIFNFKQKSLLDKRLSLEGFFTLFYEVSFKSTD